MVKGIACVVGFVLVMFAAFAIGARVQDRCGDDALLGLFCAMALGAAWVATPETLAFMERVRRALQRMDLGKEKAALLMGIDASQFSKWFYGKERPDVSKLAMLGDQFWAAFAVQALDDLGGYTVVRNADFARWANASERVADAMEPAMVPVRAVA